MILTMSLTTDDLNTIRLIVREEVSEIVTERINELAPNIVRAVVLDVTPGIVRKEIDYSLDARLKHPNHELKHRCLYA